MFKVYLISFKEKILSWKQKPICEAKMAMCID